MIELSRTQIEDCLPHREAWLLIEKANVIEYVESGLSPRLQDENPVQAYMTVSQDSWIVCGHFPGNPMIPGVILVEAMAQSAAILASALNADARGKPVLLAGVSKIRYLKPVQAPCTIEFRPRVSRMWNHMWRFACEARVEGEVVSTAELMGKIG